MRDNYVAKHGKKFNLSAVHVDRKKAADRGYEKHSNLSGSGCCTWPDKSHKLCAGGCEDGCVRQEAEEN